jgi:hypothetical protein
VGAPNAKHVPGVAPKHFDVAPFERTSSRLTQPTSAARNTGATFASIGRPRAGGRPYIDPSTVSPAQAIVTVPVGMVRLRGAARVTGLAAAAVGVTLSSASKTRVSPNAIAVAATATPASATMRRRQTARRRTALRRARAGESVVRSSRREVSVETDSSSDQARETTIVRLVPPR